MHTGNGIRIYDKNPWYWQYHGEPRLLLGGSDDDNVFNWPDRDRVRDHLELLARAGGNYDRCVISGRDKGNVRPWRTLENGKYDLAQWEPEFWNRLDFYFDECCKRGIIVQVEIWATYDVGRPGSPWNPALNINEDLHASTLVWSDNAKKTRRTFYSSVPALNNDPVLLKYQQAYVDKILECSFAYDNVIYCIDNEFNYEHPGEWFEYWARYVKEQEGRAGRRLEVTEMNQMDWSVLEKTRSGTPLSDEDKERLDGDWNCVLNKKHREVYGNRNLFSFIEIGDCMGCSSPREHWNHLRSIRDFVKDHPHPLNNTKLYGNNYNSFWTTQEAVNKYWRNLIGGCASVRFHRPNGGIGLSELAQASMKSARVFEKLMQPWLCEPRQDLLSDCGDHEACVMARDGEAYAIFFPGKVRADAWAKLRKAGGRRYRVTWINVNTAREMTLPESVSSGKWMTFEVPEFVVGGAALVMLVAQEA